MQELYTGYPIPHVHLHESELLPSAIPQIALGDANASVSIESIFMKALQQIYDEKIDVKTEIQPDLFHYSFDHLSEAVDKGAKVEFGTPNEEFINQLKTSQKVFAAFKTHRQQNDIAKQLLNEKGELKSFNQFKEDVQPIIGAYNQNWLKTEYDTSVIRARMGTKFKQFQAEIDIYPSLKWLPTTSPDPRESHRKYYGMVLPINHPFWLTHFPGNEWNCKCGITNTDEPVWKHIPGDVQDDPPPGLDGNPAITNEVFSKSHPYRTEAYPGADKAVKSFLKKQSK